ncbi:hypothetical protein FOL47_005148 [Perkinsus chesapeaki]|uniref:Uncharacterized protein n=1 Tax=Perkinsus chesapeaki TaxID=330153 RepID=A0A7J6LYK3_PERCH|nr:hypothetical protein FOL47_005148 [Perkinsus chesapeaki]
MSGSAGASVSTGGESTLYFPVDSSDDWVSLESRDLPEDGDKILDLLRMELVPLKLWHALAVEYFRQRNDTVNMMKVLEAATDKELESIQMYASQLHQMQFLMYDSMGASYLQKGLYDGDEESVKKATDMYQRGENLNPFDPRTWLSRAWTEFCNYIKSSDANGPSVGGHEALTKCVSHLGNVIKAGPMVNEGGVADMVRARLLRGAALLLLEQPKEALTEYRLVLQMAGSRVPTTAKVANTARLGIAACQMKLGNLPKAQEAIFRALAMTRKGDLDGDVVAAAAAILQAGESSSGSLDAGHLAQETALAEKAGDHPVALTILARQSLVLAAAAKDDEEGRKRYLRTARRLAEAAESRVCGKGARPLLTEICLLKAKITHAEGDVEKAKKLYEEATKQLPLGSMHYSHTASSNKDTPIPSMLPTTERLSCAALSGLIATSADDGTETGRKMHVHHGKKLLQLQAVSAANTDSSVTHGGLRFDDAIALLLARQLGHAPLPSDSRKALELVEGVSMHAKQAKEKHGTFDQSLDYERHKLYVSLVLGGKNMGALTKAEAQHCLQELNEFLAAKEENKEEDVSVVQALITRGALRASALKEPKRGLDDLARAKIIMLKTDGGGVDAEAYRVLWRTRVFNKGLCYEGMATTHGGMSGVDRALKTYRRLVERQPDYTDAMVRIGKIYENVRGDLSKAEEWYRKAMDAVPLKEGGTTMGALCRASMQHHKLRNAAAGIKTIRDNCGSHNDPYIYELLGDMHVDHARSSYAKTQIDEKDSMNKAIKFYLKAIAGSTPPKPHGTPHGTPSSPPHAVSAIMGIAAVLGHRGRKQQAMDLLTSIEEHSTGWNWAASANLGHLYVDEYYAMKTEIDEKKRADKSHGALQIPPQLLAAEHAAARRAVKCYEGAMKTYTGGDSTIKQALVLYLSNAYFLADRHNDSIDMLNEAVVMWPENLRFKYNLAMVLENYAAASLLDSTKKNQAEWVKKALLMVRCALGHFRSIESIAGTTPMQAIPRILKRKIFNNNYITNPEAFTKEMKAPEDIFSKAFKRHFEYLRDTSRKAEDWLRKLEVTQNVHEETMRLIEKERNERMEREKREQEAKEEEDKRRREELDREAENRMDVIRSSVANMGQEEEEEEEVAAGKKRKRPANGGNAVDRRSKAAAKKKAKAVEEDNFINDEPSSSDSESSSSSSSSSSDESQSAAGSASSSTDKKGSKKSRKRSQKRNKRRLRKGPTDNEDSAPRQQTDGEVLEELFGDVDI